MKAHAPSSWHFRLTLVLLAALALPASLTAQDAPSAAKVKAQIRQLVDSDVKSSLADGVVTLQGKVTSPAEKRQLVEEIEELPGVVRVTADQLEVRPEQRPANQIKQDVQAALSQDPALQDQALQVSVEGAVVTLKGQVSRAGLRRLAVETVEAVRGVQEVRDGLEVPGERRPDATVQADVEVALTASVVTNDDLKVKVRDGRVTLSGQVDTALERRWAVATAWAVEGVQAVDASGVRVNPLQWNRPKETGPIAQDDQIRTAIITLLSYEPRVRAHRPDVQVQDGRVRLTGQVASLAAKRRAEQIARRTSGVQAVENQLEVRPMQKVTDAAMAEQAQAALERNAIVEAEEVQADVQDGRLTLKGAVNSLLEKRIAEDVVARVAGVTTVNNQLRVSRRPEY